MLGWPVISVMASGHGLLKPSFMASLEECQGRETESEGQVSRLPPQLTPSKTSPSLNVPLGLGGPG